MSEELIPISHLRCRRGSEVALCWIRGEDRELTQFVQNRVREIRRLVPPTARGHCSSKENYRRPKLTFGESEELIIYVLSGVQPHYVIISFIYLSPRVREYECQSRGLTSQGALV